MRRAAAWLLAALACAAPLPDPRNIATGLIIPDEGYSDQPYVVITRDGNWLCVMTTGKGVEGESGQHVVATVSSDQGASWSPLADIEPATGPEASWAMPLVTPYGRVYVFYTYNKDNLREVRTNWPPLARRADTLGAYVFKFSDDNGRTWSRERYEIPMRRMRIDRENDYRGSVLLFWGVGKPIVHGRAAIFGFAKVGRWGQPGTIIESQGCFLRSENILTERDPRRIRWETLPQGDEGLRAPKGPVAEETNLVPLGDGSLYAVWRTIDGYLCQASSRDGGRSWTPPEYASYSPGGRPIKHPRAAGFVRRFSNGKFLLWFHNHGGEAAASAENWRYYEGRNPAWISGGVERNGRIEWSEPEILLYDDDPTVRISYPDFIEDRGRFFVTETQKSVARVHPIDRALLDAVWNQFDNRAVAPGGRPEMPRLPNLRERGGFSIEFLVRFRDLGPGQTLLDTRDGRGKGIAITTSNRFSLRLTLNDSQRQSVWESDPGTHPGTLRANAVQHVVVTVDGGPKIVTWIVDGVLNDGGAVRDYGWGRFDPAMEDVNGASPRIAANVSGLRFYTRPLLTSEAVGNWRAAGMVRRAAGPKAPR